MFPPLATQETLVGSSKQISAQAIVIDVVPAEAPPDVFTSTVPVPARRGILALICTSDQLIKSLVFVSVCTPDAASAFRNSIVPALAPKPEPLMMISLLLTIVPAINPEAGVEPVPSVAFVIVRKEIWGICLTERGE